MSNVATAGAKAMGLSRLPEAWTPEFVCIAPSVLAADELELSRVVNDLADRFAGRRIIVRSSASVESLADRGRFESIRPPMTEPEHIVDALRRLRNQGDETGVAMGAVVQAYHHPVMRGHLSNERRVSKTRNQWQVEVDYPAPDDFRINSQRDAQPALSRSIALRSAGLRRTLGGVGSWAAREFDSRVHIEWVLERETLWIVQLDREDDAPDHGVDPRQVEPEVESDLVTAAWGGSPGSSYFEPWQADAFPRYRKLRHVVNFREVVSGRFPQLHVLRGENVETFLHSPTPTDTLRGTVGERLVCRTDLVPEARSRFQGLNLPRTDTLRPEAIIDFIRVRFDEFRRQDVDAEALVFIIHRFIPSVASAWAEAVPGEPIVTIDALWGLPDGLQYLEHDRFEWDIKLNSLSAEHITYKDSFLYEATDGTWTRRPVRRSLARTASISRGDVAFIGEATRVLADSIGNRLRVMWFVGTRSGASIASAIPWFCHQPEPPPNPVEIGELLVAEEVQDRSQPRRLPRIDICTPADLDRIPANPQRLRLIPTPDHMRDNSFIEAFAERAKSGGHAIEMMGSGLAHAYYIMIRSGAPIIVPSQRGHTRVRKLRTFGKLVRDGIPDKIRRGGEEVRSMRVQQPEEKRRVLLSKVLEEALEVAETTNPDDVRSELADLLEVVRSLVCNEGLEWAEVERAADDKAARLGAFNDGMVLLNTAASGPGLDRRSRSIDAAATRVVRDGNTVMVPHLALIGESIELSIAGYGVRLTLMTDGLTVEELGPESDGGQLRLPLGEAMESTKR